jgi:hypothetical protein
MDMGDSFTCVQCNISQINILYTSENKIQYIDFDKILKNYNLIYELCERLNLDENLKVAITYFYNVIISKLGPTSYNRKYIMIYAIYNISIRYNIFIPANKLCKLIACPLNMFHKRCTFKKNKGLDGEMPSIEMVCTSLLIQLGLHNKNKQQHIISMVHQIAIKSDTKF